MPTNPRRKPQPGPKSFDVFRPGKMLSSPTSRPVILGRHPAVHDSTLKETSSHVATEMHEGRPLMDSQKKVAIEPAAHEETSASEASPGNPLFEVAADAPVDSPAKAIEQSALGITATSETVSQESTKSQPETVLTPEPAPHAGVVIDNNKPINVPDEPNTPEVAKIVVSQHAGSGGRLLRPILIVLLVLILAVAAVDVALDAGAWNPSFNLPHTNFLG